MTLRLRLVVGLLVLVTIGLAVFGFATTTLYSNSEYSRLDTQLRASESVVERQLDGLRGAGTAGDSGSASPFPGVGAQGPPPGDDGSGGPGGPHGLPPAFIPPYAELLASDGTVLSHVAVSDTDSQPKLPAHLPKASGPNGRLFTVGATSGSGRFRVLEMPRQDGTVVIVAVPTNEATKAVHGLIFIETLGALVLLGALSAGSWLLLRRGLRPLERMAGTARAISGGDLAERVPPNGGRDEVAQLGTAFNTMLDDIEEAFAERDATEQRLRQFLADASHELRTPLTSIQGFAELFRVSGENAAVDLPTILRRIEQESARMKTLVEDLLLLARLDQTRAAERSPTDLAVLAADACTDAVAIGGGRKVTLDAPEPVVVAGDQAHLRQAIANLVTNAVRHTPDGTAIDVSARLVDGQAIVEVRDHGPGLDDEALHHVFDRFWQADRARAGSGSGLGLAIVAGIAEEHGGTVGVRNAEDGGAAFTLRMPVS